MTRSPVPNVVLRSLLAEAEWTEQELARQVNILAGEAGFVLRLDRRSVAHWLAGRRPRPPIPELVAEAFSREVGRTLTVEDVGLGPRPRSGQGRSGGLSDHTAQAHRGRGPGTGPDGWDGHAVEMLRQLGYDRGHHRIPSAGAFSVAALTVPSWAQAVAHRSSVLAEGSGTTSLEPGLITTAELITTVFSDADLVFGGGHSRAALAAYLANEIAPLLSARGSRKLQLRATAAATRLAYLCGFMCFDDNQHARAQQYYRTALSLAVDNGDAHSYAVTLRAMSVQAHALGHAQPAVNLAEAAATTGRKIPPLRQAFLLGQVAVAAAASTDRNAALSALTAAERHFERATSQHDGPDGIDLMGGYHLAALGHQQAVVRALLGDRAGAITALSASLRHRPSIERRSRAITNARLAELHLDNGHLEQAATVWHSFLDDYPHLTSERANTALKTLRQRLRPHAAQHAAKHLLARAAAV